jgi:hypothetical protein
METEGRQNMSSVATALPTPKINIGQLLKVVGLPTERERTSTIVGQANDLVREVVSVIDGLIVTSIDQRTSADFVKMREEVFPQYVAAITALGSLARIIMPKQSIERISLESFSQMEADFRDLGDSTFGTDLAERGLFTVWTLRKIYDIAKEIENSELPKEQEQAKEDTDKARDFVRYALWNRFHVDCLVKSMRTKKAIYPDVVEQVRDGLRAAVNAYAHIRQWADIRNPRPDVDPGEIEWTSEDEDLLADSMRDLEQTA